MIQMSLTRNICRAMLAFLWALLAGCAPIHLWDTHTTSTPRPQSFDVAALTGEPVATFGLLASAGLQGFNPVLSHALIAALAEASPPIKGIPNRETLNTLNEQALAAAYGDLVTGCGRSGILEREQLRRIGSALGSRYVLLPGLAEFNETIIDRLAISGWKFIQSRVTTLRLWLQLWDMQTTDLGRVKFLLQDLGFSAGCGLLASFIPLGTTRTSFLYGLTMPLALALLVLTVAH